MGANAGSSYEWGWAREMRAWVQKHPAESYKRGLYCLSSSHETTAQSANVCVEQSQLLGRIKFRIQECGHELSQPLLKSA